MKTSSIAFVAALVASVYAQDNSTSTTDGGSDENTIMKKGGNWDRLEEILKRMQEFNCFDYNTAKSKALQEYYDAIQDGRPLFVSLVHNNHDNWIHVECGCEAMSYDVAYCMTGYSLVAIAGSNEKPCRFRYSGDGGFSNIRYGGWANAASRTYYVGGWCDNYSPLKFGLTKGNHAQWPDW
ncbi:Aste57867_8868 [Aphanomyces stellatus]|uniref:Aste57867_8868 protein n=1 Tax=Aphanomyces stellatus TaxID=120398 RepID=A0A485KLK6_9STRA|nr:hypothetical protein As57867_008833 [Aphanomyces stellatus]VFT85754.1 Aste57867_8868 [Aphanomyces stellatus]